MATLYTPAGVPVEIPDAQVHDALASRKFFVPGGEQLPIESGADGSLSSIPSEQVYEAIQRGDRILGPAEAEARAAQEKYGTAGQGAITAAEQALSGATAGISEAAEKALGVPPEDIAGRKAAHPIIAPGFAVTGAVLPALFGDEVAPVSLIAKGGEGVESFFGSGLAGAMLRGATEASTYGAVDEASQQAFSGKPADVSKILSVAGTDALYGGGAGGLFSVLGAIGRVGAGLTGRGAEQAGVDGAVIHDISDALEAKATEDPTTLGGKVLSALMGRERGAAMGRLTGDRAWRELANVTDADAEKLYIDGAGGISSLMRDFQGALNEVRNTVKPAEITEGLKAVDPLVARNRLFDLSNKVDDAIAEMRAQPENYFDSGKITLLEKQNEALKKVIGVEPVGVKGFHPTTGDPIPTFGLDPKKIPSAQELWEEADRFRDKLGTIGKLGMSVPETEQAAANRVNQIRKELVRPLLEDENVFGAAAAAQAKRNQQISAGIQLIDDFNEAFGKGTGYAGGERTFAVDPGKIKRLFQNAGSAENELPRATFMNFLTGARDLAEQVGTANTDLRDRLATLLPGTKDLVRLSKARADLAKVAGRTGEAASIFGPAPLMRATAGAVIGGPLGAVIGAAAGPAAIPRVLHVLDRIVGAQNGKIAAFASAIARGVRPAIGRAGTSTTATLESARFSDRAYGDKARDSDEAFQRRAGEIRSSLSGPLARRLAATSAVLAPLAAEHPAAATAAAQQGERAMQLLAAQIPPSAPGAAAALDPTGAGAPPSHLEQADFADAIKAFKSPISVMEDFAHGRLSPIAAQNLRAMYPELHQEMVGAVLSAVQQSGKRMPYLQRLQFSVFAGQDMDGSLAPASIVASQAVYAPAPAAGGGATPEAPKMQSTKTVKSIANAASAMQNLESRSEHV